MSSALIRFTSFGIALMFVAGCGGGSSNGGSGGGGGGGGNPTTVTVTFQDTPPTAVAAKIGSSAFTPQMLSAGSVSLSVPSGTKDFAVAYICLPQAIDQVQLTEQFVVEATTEDSTSYLLQCPPNLTTSQTGSLTGSVDTSAITGTNFVNIDAAGGGNLSIGAPDDGSQFNFQAPLGSDEVDVLALVETISGNEFSLTLNGVKTFTNQTVPGSLNGGDTVVFTAADATTPEPLTYNNLPPESSVPVALAVFERADVSGFGMLLATAAHSQYPALPPGIAQNGDFYVVQAQANSGTIGNDTVVELATFSNPAPLTITFPSPWAYAGPTPAALPTMDFSSYSGFSGKSGVARTGVLAWVNGSTTQSEFRVTASTNYQNSSTSLTFPDLSGLAGFLAAPPSGSSVNWEADITQNTAGFAIGVGKLGPNLTISEVSNEGTFTVP